MRYGRYKLFTNRLRRASKIIDVVDLPLDGLIAVPLIGPVLAGLDEIAGVGACALAGVLDVAGCLKEGDLRGALQEFCESAAETFLVAMPGLGSVQVMFDLRQYLRDRVGDRCAARFNPGAALEHHPSGKVGYWRFSI